jgi:hypothetical protein
VMANKGSASQRLTSLDMFEGCTVSMAGCLAGEFCCCSFPGGWSCTCWRRAGTDGEAFAAQKLVPDTAAVSCALSQTESSGCFRDAGGQSSGLLFEEQPGWLRRCKNMVEEEFALLLSQVERQLILEALSPWEGPNLGTASFMLALAEVPGFSELCTALTERLRVASSLSVQSAFLSMFRCVRTIRGQIFCRCQRLGLATESLRHTFSELESSQLSSAEIRNLRTSSLEFRILYACLVRDFAFFPGFSDVAEDDLLQQVDNFLKRQHARIYRGRMCLGNLEALCKGGCTGRGKESSVDSASSGLN